MENWVGDICDRDALPEGFKHKVIELGPFSPSPFRFAGQILWDHDGEPFGVIYSANEPLTDEEARARAIEMAAKYEAAQDRGDGRLI